MGLSAELHQYAVDLTFNGGDPSGGFSRLEQFGGDCADPEDYIIMLQILAYAKGPVDLPLLVDFLEKCFKSDSEEVRRFVSFFTAPRFLKKGGMPRERLLPILKHVSENDPSEAVKKSAVAGLFLIGEISEEAFHLACDQVN